MALKAADRVKETTELVGTGNVTLTGAVVGFRSVISALSVGDSHDFCIDSGGAEWEVSTCTLVSSTVLTRNTVKASSNGVALVSFSPGTKQVFLMPSAINGLLNASLAKMAANTVKANITGASADPADVAKTSFVSWLALTAADVSGVVSAASISAVGYSGQYADILSKPALVSVATSGSASDLTTGILPAARLPTPAASTLGGILAATGTAGQFVTGISTAGAPTFGTPAGGTGGGGSAVIIGTTAPSTSTTTAGQLWWKSDEGSLKISYTDADSTQWVDAASNAGGGGMVKIAKVVTTGSATITFSSIPQNYTDLKIVFQGRDTNAGATNYALRLRINGDTTSGNYQDSLKAVTGANGGDGLLHTGTDAATSSGALIGLYSGKSGNSSAVTIVEVTIPNYSGAAFYKNFISDYSLYYDSTPFLYRGLTTGLWKNTAPVTDLVLTTAGTAFENGTTAILYGLG